MYYTLLPQLLQQTCLHSPDRTALVYEEQHYSYRYILDAATYWARLWQQRGLQRGDRVIIHLGNSLATIISFWATLLADAVVTLIPWDVKEAALHAYLLDAEPAVLLIQSLSSTDAFLSYPFLQQIYSADLINCDNAINKIYPLPVATMTGYQAITNQNIELDLAAIIYTSGTTGTAKGVMLTHRNMLSAVFSINAYLQHQSSDKFLLALPLSFDYGLYQMIMAFSVGACLVLEKNALLPFQLLKQIEKQQISVLPCVPTLFQLLITQAQQFTFQYHSLRIITNTGAALYPALIDKLRNTFPHALLFSMYGLTECKRCTYLPPKYLTQKPNSVGIAIPNTELWIIDEHGNKVPPGVVGQVVIRGPTVMRGYWRKPEQTTACLLDGKCEKVLLTGDYGVLDEDGFLYLTGRKDDVVKVRGVKINLMAIEAQLSQLAGVLAVAATVTQLADDNKFVLYIVKADDFTEAQIKDAIRQSLAKSQQFDYIFFRSCLPKNANGKIDKHSLKNSTLGLVAHDQSATN